MPVSQEPLANNTGATNTATQTGATSGFSNWIPDFLTIGSEACEMAGVDFTSAYSIRSLKRSLDLLSMEWANEGLNLWTIEQQQLVLQPGVAEYDLPVDTIDLMTASIRTSENGRQIDLAIARQDFVSYASLPDKQQTGRPNLIFIQRSAVPQAFVWPVPDTVKTYTLVWWRLRRMQNTGYATSLPDVPFRLIPALTKGLAWQMSLKKTVKDWNLINSLERMYRSSFMEAKYEDRDRSSVFFAPCD